MTSLISYGLQVFLGSSIDTIYQGVLFHTSDADAKEYKTQAYQQLFATYSYILGGVVATTLLKRKISQLFIDQSFASKVEAVAGSIIGNLIVLKTIQSPIVHGFTSILGFQYLLQIFDVKYLQNLQFFL